MSDRQPSPARGLAVLRRRWLGSMLAYGWIVFLLPSIVTALQAGNPRSVIGGLALAAFAAAYVIVASRFRGFFNHEVRYRPSIPLYAAMLAFAVLALALLKAGALGVFPFIAVMGPLLFMGRGIWVVIAAAMAAEGFSRAFTGQWGDNQGVATGVLAAGLSVWGFTLLMQRNHDTVRAREAEAALVLVRQQDRFARDLHDILGHSLTVITLKAELAGRLIERSPSRAQHEIGELERLSREALSDVRRAVEGYREISLSGEIARAREALRVGGIEARLPTAIDDVPEERRELFAWVVREGVTNVLRHSRATRCAITLDAHSVTIDDDGRGLPRTIEGAGGYGVTGLRERAQSVGGQVTLSARSPRGARLRLECPA